MRPKTVMNPGAVGVAESQGKNIHIVVLVAVGVLYGPVAPDHTCSSGEPGQVVKTPTPAAN